MDISRYWQLVMWFLAHRAPPSEIDYLRFGGHLHEMKTTIQCHQELAIIFLFSQLL